MRQAKIFLIAITLFITTSCAGQRTQYVPVTMNKSPRPARMPDFQDTDTTKHPGSWVNLEIMYHNHSKAVRHIELLNGVIDAYEFRIDNISKDGEPDE